ncbi:polycystin cation channel protein, partial [Toxoplasma gondii MAS]
MQPMPAVLSAKAVNRPKPIPASKPYEVPLRELPYVPVCTPAPAPEAPATAEPAPRAPLVVQRVMSPVAASEELVVPQKKVREKRQRENELLDPSKLDVGEVIRCQKTLMQREAFRRRLFPVSFEYAAGQVSEGDIILGRRPNVVEALAHLLFLVAFILFVAANAQVARVHTTNASLQDLLAATDVPSGSAFNAWSALAAETAGATTATVKGSDSLFLSLRTLQTKADVASWLRYGLFGLPTFPKVGRNVICGPCVRLTVRRLNWTDAASEVGYTEVWPVDSVAPTRALGTDSLQLTSLNEALAGTAAAGTRLQWTYTPYPVDSSRTFQGTGGYAETICGEDAETMLQHLSQNQPLSRYPPWFLPNGLIGSRRTVTVVADFLSVNPESYSTSYTYIPFQFTSAGTLLPVRVWSQTALSAAGQNSAGLRYGSLAAAVLFFVAYAACMFLKVRELQGLRHFVNDWWNCFAVAHFVLVLLTFLFFALASFGSGVPTVSRQVGKDGAVTVQSDWLSGDLTETFNEKAAAVAAVHTKNQLFWTVAAITIFCSCILTIQYLQVWGGAAAKTMNWTMKRLILPVLMCICFMLVILLLFVAIGNICFGVDNRAFAGFYESLTASAAFLLGGTVGNFDVYDIVANHRVFAGLYFGPLFIMFSFLCFNILIALILKIYELCAEEVEKAMKKRKKQESEFKPTRLERWIHGLSAVRKQLESSLASMKSKERIVDIASEDSETEKEENDVDGVPRYPA